MARTRRNQAIIAVLMGLDLGATALAWVLAYWLRWRVGLPPVDQVPPFWWCLRELPIVLIAAVLAYRAARLYDQRRRTGVGEQIARIVRGTTLLLLFVLAATFYFQNEYQSRSVTILFWVGTVVGLLLVRQGFGLWLRFQRRSRVGMGLALVVGTGRMARSVERALRDHPWFGYVPMGFVDDLEPSPSRATRTVGGIDDLPRLVEQYGIDTVLIALPLERYAEVRRVARLLENSLVEMRLVPDIPPSAAMDVEVSELEGLPILDLRPQPHPLPELLVKRAMDIALSTIGLVVLSPVLGLIALWIKLSDGGPVLYAQERMGLNGRRFAMLKFRTMRVNAESETGPVWAKPGDNRRTRLGTFLRQTSLDELPQLWNVLRGDMSLVGPRPERPFFIQNFRQTIPRYMLRHSVRAGITGWAQVHGWRGNTSLRKRVQYDLYYISHWSIWLDVRILFLTVFRVLGDRNAY